MNSLIFLAQQQSGSLLGSLLPFVGIAFVMWLLIIRPQAKQQREQDDFRSALKTGDRVITAGGILGKITEVRTKAVQLEIAPKTKIWVLKSQVIYPETDEVMENKSASDDSDESTKK